MEGVLGVAHLLAAVLASWRLTELVTMDRLTEPLRRRWPSYLWGCSRCVSVWAGAACTAGFLIWPFLNWPLAFSWLFFVKWDWTLQRQAWRRQAPRPHRPMAGGSDLWAGILDPTRAITWENAGIPGGIPVRATLCASITSTGADQTTEINNALTACPAGQVVSLAAGTFRINGTLNVPSNVTLRGQGANQTILDLHGTSGSAVVLGIAGSDPIISGSVSITSGATAGSTSIVVSSAAGMSVGQYLLITELNDSTFVSINGSEGACTFCDGGIGWNGTRVLGQVVEVTAISGTTISISPLYIAYPNTPLATPFTASKYAGVENLQLYANNTGYTTNFKMVSCAYCWIKGVEGNYADGDHAEIDWSYRGEVRDNYFSNAYSHTAGGTDADVVLRNKSSAMLVQNNIFERLHTSLMMEWGTAGNVLAYNYMLGGFATSGGGGANFLIGHIATHGAHPMFNLLEGNIAPNANLDSIWGTHSHNTLFRNWLKGTTKLCNPPTGRGTVVCSPMGILGAPGVNGWWAVQYVHALSIDFMGSYYNSVGNVLGSPEMAALLSYNTPGFPMAQTRMVVGVCGPTPCGPGSRSYDATCYAYSLGYGEASDDGSQVNTNCPGGGPANTPVNLCDSVRPYDTLFLHGDYDTPSGTITWSGSVTHTLPPSFYLSAKPSWFGSATWPTIGPDVTGGSGPGGHASRIPAQICYEDVMGGTDSRDSPLPFNAATCYEGTAAVSPKHGHGMRVIRSRMSRF